MKVSRMNAPPPIKTLPLAASLPLERSANQRFAALYDAHAERVYGWCVRLCNGNPSDAEDLAQETFVAAFQSLPRFQSRAKTTTWLYRIALRKFWAWRETNSRVPTGDETNPIEHLPDSVNFAGASLERLRLQTALSTLSPPLREAFLLVKAEGFTHKEAARVLNVPTGTVQSRVHDAAHKLRVLLAEPEESAITHPPVSSSAALKGNSRHAL